jgi:YidC/Oxa1 family membrane protein insertase
MDKVQLILWAVLFVFIMLNVRARTTAMLLAARLNPSVLDPTQARIQKIMPIVWAAMMAWAPAGLVLYQITNSLLTAAQQWRLNQLVGLA